MESMPLSGRHGAGANVWVQDGSVWIYLGHNGAYDSNGRLLKLGCIRLTPDNLKLGERNFTQELNLSDGTIYITQDDMNISLWFADQDLIVETKAKNDCRIRVEYGTWRDVNREGLLQDMFKNKGNYCADHVEPNKDGILWFHDNKDEHFDLSGSTSAQGISSDCVYDVTSERVFGGALVVDGGLDNIETNPVEWQYWKGRAWSANTVSSKAHLMVVSLGAGFGANPADWKRRGEALLNKNAREKARKNELALWNDFWSRSHIYINPDKQRNDNGFLAGRNYQLFRYMLACNRGGEFPLLFNGGIFTVDNVPHYIKGNNNDELPIWEEGESSPDFRRWMYCYFMSQNQRWLGWPTIANGDTDLLYPTTLFYRNREKVAAARARKNGAKGVVYPEPLNVWGLCCVAPLPNGLCGAQHLTYHFSMMLDNAWMNLVAHSTLGTPIEKDLGWIEGTVYFYDSYYRAQNLKLTGKELGDDGKLVLYPTNALEHADSATNAVDAVCGLRRVTDALLRLKELSPESRTKLELISSTIPDIPIGIRNGKKSILPAKSFKSEYNVWEPTEMVAAFPYKIVGATHPETVQLLRDTYQTIPDNRASCKKDYSWMPNLANAAAMVLPEEAKKRIIYKMSNTEAPQARFPAFFGPGHDWLPDHNWGGSGMTGTQEMLLTADPYSDGKIYLLFAWPKDWNVEFKLHAPEMTTVSCKVKNGKVVSLNVIPKTRKKDIVIDPRFI